MPGVQTVVWDLKNDTVKVHYDGTTVKPEQIAAAIEAAEDGFHATLLR